LKVSICSLVRPFLVLISTTPLDALLPYNEAADESLSTLTVAMLFGSSFLKSSPWTGIPSTMYSGFVLLVGELAPRMTILFEL